VVWHDVGPEIVVTATDSRASLPRTARKRKVVFHLDAQGRVVSYGIPKRWSSKLGVAEIAAGWLQDQGDRATPLSSRRICVLNDTSAKEQTLRVNVANRIADLLRAKGLQVDCGSPDYYARFGFQTIQRITQPLRQGTPVGSPSADRRMWGTGGPRDRLWIQLSLSSPEAAHSRRVSDVVWEGKASGGIRKRRASLFDCMSVAIIDVLADEHGGPTRRPVTKKIDLDELERQQRCSLPTDGEP
jgi:hypothetical protein